MANKRSESGMPAEQGNRDRDEMIGDGGRGQEEDVRGIGERDDEFEDAEDSEDTEDDTEDEDEEGSF